MADMDEATARRLFTTARLARLATAGADGMPHLVPVTFALDGGDVVWAVDAKPKTTTALRRLRNIAAQRGVCLLVDHYDEDWSMLWWVRADGDASVAGAGQDTSAVAALVAKYSQYARTPPEGPVVRVRVRTWRGWSATPQAIQQSQRSQQG
ncbi:TIGR03668 family PPOX class F420-dependent oxidoreductase [Saccharomonospora xinjiangensis]|uniref:TIGR03668 family PPOX class F420-dependent oxidoreductase n=1 Tax=Saccharomonospora xinjiangensis TaxID=75294 RepID=UPI00106F22EF|nr:TIGR03668 family PPOX class F420-dependent oxidoreductase [Saccharomonospora xinjiangensis]QBQ60475.1 Pyridoxamine 5'-phosphate oxidase [Saccharomonospora xinjiangensis]